MAIISDNRDEIRRFILKETTASAAVNGVLTAGATWLTFSEQQQAPVWGMDGLAFDLLPSTFIPVLLMGVILPTVIAARLRSGSERGGVPLIDRRDLRQHLGLWGRVAPRSMMVRALLLAFVLAFLLVPIGLAALWISGLTAAPLTHVLAGKAVWGGGGGGDRRAPGDFTGRHAVIPIEINGIRRLGVIWSLDTEMDVISPPHP